LARLPVEIVETVDTLWQRALALAAQAATHDDNAARERLAQIQLENDLRSQSLALREKEYDTAARERERALTETRDQLRALLRMLERERATVRAKEKRIADLEKQMEDARDWRKRSLTRRTDKINHRRVPPEGPLSVADRTRKTAPKASPSKIRIPRSTRRRQKPAPSKPKRPRR
jgi:septal ring factor EnvC (AmiA/AmiB activator)